MEIGAMLDELREKALKDCNIWQKLMDTRKADSLQAAVVADYHPALRHSS